MTDIIAPSMVRLPPAAYQLGRLVFSLGSGRPTCSWAILLCRASATAPVHRRMLGLDRLPHRAIRSSQGLRPPSGWASSSTPPAETRSQRYNEENPVDSLYDTANVFDPQASWLIDHQNARPVIP